jgi:N-acetylglucosamine-6-phosphate deacetylase
MSVIAFTGARILSERGWLVEHALVVDGARVKGLAQEHWMEPEIARVALDGGALIPGFIDVQVNGGGGVLFNDAPTVEAIRTIAATHRRYGTTGLLPTLISDDLPVIAAAIAAVDEAIAAGVPGVLGIHIEGPFLNEAKRGIHDASKFRRLDAAAIDLLSSLKNGRTLVTLAPELAPPGAIRALVDRGVLVAAGHSQASFEEMQAARAEGLTGVTHLFNAMSQLQSRAPGVVGAALAGDVFAGLIVDGHHVHPGSLRAALKAKGPVQLMLVTDAMANIGSKEKSFRLGGRLITETDGALRDEAGVLAGASLTMIQAVTNAMAMMEIDLATAAQMASHTPAAFLGLSKMHGRLAPLARADFLHIGDDHTLKAVWVGGERV